MLNREVAQLGIPRLAESTLYGPSCFIFERYCCFISLTLMTGWCSEIFIIPYIGNNNPNWLIFFRGVETTNQMKFLGILLLLFCYFPIHDTVIVAGSCCKLCWKHRKASGMTSWQAVLLKQQLLGKQNLPGNREPLISRKIASNRSADLGMSLYPLAMGKTPKRGGPSDWWKKPHWIQQFLSFNLPVWLVVWCHHNSILVGYITIIVY